MRLARSLAYLAAPGPYQQVLIDFQIAFIVGQKCCSMKGRETFVVPLIDLRAELKEVMDLEQKSVLFSYKTQK